MKTIIKKYILIKKVETIFNKYFLPVYIYIIYLYTNRKKKPRKMRKKNLHIIYKSYIDLIFNIAIR